MAAPGTTLPFVIKRSSDEMDFTEITSTTEEVHGILRIEEDVLVVQWSTARQTERVGITAIRTERDLDPAREVRLPLVGLGGATYRWRWWLFQPRATLVIRAADLKAFRILAGDSGLLLEHPAELRLGVRWGDRALAKEFAAELELQLADRALEAAEARVSLGARSRERLSGG